MFRSRKSKRPKTTTPATKDQTTADATIKVPEAATHLTMNEALPAMTGPNVAIICQTLQL